MCSIQPEYTGMLLVISDEMPRSEPLDSQSICVASPLSGGAATANDYRRACRDLCLGTAGCNSFLCLRHLQTQAWWICCMRKRYALGVGG